MAKIISYYQGKQNAAIWAHDEAAFFNMLPNGAKLKIESVTPALLETYDSVYPMVYSGVLVGRIPGARKYSLINPAASTFTYNNATTLAAPAANGATQIIVTDVDGYAAGQAITVAGAAHTIASVQPMLSQITLTVGVAAARAAGAAVQLATPLTIPNGDIYLMFTDIVDIVENNEFTIYRHDRAVYQNKLPGWANYSTAAKALLKANYVAFDTVTIGA
jgi:hypothetical protein